MNKIELFFILTYFQFIKKVNKITTFSVSDHMVKLIFRIKKMYGKSIQYCFIKIFIIYSCKNTMRGTFDMLTWGIVNMLKDTFIRPRWGTFVKSNDPYVGHLTCQK